MHVSPNVTLGEALSDSNFGSHRGIALSELADWVNTQNDRSTLQKLLLVTGGGSDRLNGKILSLRVRA